MANKTKISREMDRLVNKYKEKQDKEAKSSETKPKKRKPRQLTEKQLLFCKYMYTTGSETFGNGSRSYMKAYPNCKSEKAASVRQSELVADSRIIKEKKRIQAKTEQKVVFTRDMVIECLANIAKDSESSRRDCISALSLLSEVSGYKRDNAPNLERLPDLHDAFTEEEIASLRSVVQEKTKEEAKQPFKFGKTG